MSFAADAQRTVQRRRAAWHNPATEPGKLAPLPERLTARLEARIGTVEFNRGLPTKKGIKAKLTTAHCRLVYYDSKAQGGPQVVLQFINGQDLIP